MRRELDLSARDALPFLVLLLASFLFCFFRGVMTLINVWKDSYIYSYGFLIPFISGYLAWYGREKLRSLDILPHNGWGICLLLVALAMYISGIALRIASLQGLAIVLAVAGMVLLVLGKRFLWAMWFPIAYLLFMVPFWDNLTDVLHPAFQRLSAAVAGAILSVIGIPNVREGTFIELPRMTLEVAQVCSGVSNMMAVMAFSAPLAYIFLSGCLKRTMFLFGSVIIVVVLNGLRVALIGLLAYRGAGDVLHGPYHVLQAMSVSAVGYVLLTFVAGLLSEHKMNNAASVSMSDTQSASRNVGEEELGWDAHIMLLASAALTTVGICVNFLPQP